MNEESILNAKSFVELNKENRLLLKLNQELLREKQQLKEECYREKSLKELYKDRIDKAIFFLENSDYGKMRFGIDLLEILKGGKDE